MGFNGHYRYCFNGYSAGLALLIGRVNFRLLQQSNQIYWLQFLTNITTTKNKEDTSKLPILPKKARSRGEPIDFVDYKQIVCQGGRGGDGVISFLREKNAEFAGPDGGNGGNGGHVIFKADSTITDLSHIAEFINAPNGEYARDRCCHGKNAEHLYISMPLNTLIKKPSSDELRPSKTIIYELQKEGDLFIAARGGAGGHGNAFYTSNAVRKPLKAEMGGRGEKLSYDIEMRVMATAGFVGIPNVGKSTLLRAISRAKPKVAAYPFTTLKPSVGMVEYGDFFQVGVADIPGLVEGAHRNEGLGFSFLRHIMRCECILYVLDLKQGDLRKQHDLLKNELNSYEPELMQKEAAIIVNKIDLADDEAKIKEMIAAVFPGFNVFLVSGRHRIGLEALLMFLRETHEKYLLEREARIEMDRIQLLL